MVRTVLECLCVVKGLAVTLSQADVCAGLVSVDGTVGKAVLRAGLERIVISAVTAAMAECVTLLQDTAAVHWAGQETPVRKCVPEDGMVQTAVKCVTVRITAHATE